MRIMWRLVEMVLHLLAFILVLCIALGAGLMVFVVGFWLFDHTGLQGLGAVAAAAGLGWVVTTARMCG